MNALSSSIGLNPVKFSIIIPVYNAEEYLADTFRSILSQKVDKESYEIIVIDDGSIDSSLEIIRRFEKFFPNFKYLTQQNRGVSVARNKGLDCVAGEYIMFLDSDDTLKPDVLSKVTSLTEGSNSDIYFFGGSYTSRLEKYEPDKFLSTFYFSVYVWKTCIKTSLIKNKGLRFSEGYILEDGVFLLEAIIKASEIATFKLDLVSYNANKKSLTRDYSNKEKNQKMISSFVFIINKYQQLINSVQGSISESAYFNLLERKESFIFFMFFRMMRYRFSNKEIEESLNKVNFYDRFVGFPGKYHKAFVYKLLTPIVQSKNLRSAFAATYKLMKPELPPIHQWIRIRKPAFLRHVHLLEAKKLHA